MRRVLENSSSSSSSSSSTESQSDEVSYKLFAKRNISDDYSEESGKEATCKLPPLEAAACACILEEAVEQLTILGTISESDFIDDSDIQVKSLEERFSADTPDTQLFDPQTLERSEIVKSKQKHVKYQKDRSFVETILQDTINMLLNYNSYGTMVNHLEAHNRALREEEEFIESAAEKKNQLKELNQLCKTERAQALDDITTQSQLIGNLKDQIEDTYFENNIKLKYLQTWENSRIEQNDMRLKMKEDDLLDTIKQTKINIEREVRIKSEIESYITEIQTEYEEQIQYWMERYDREVESMDTAIQVLKEKREVLFTNLQELAKKYEHHKQQIEDYLAEKEQRRQEEERLKLMNLAATKIQAWWRGVMVRRCLGPFRKGKGKGKGAKGPPPKKGKK